MNTQELLKSGKTRVAWIFLLGYLIVSFCSLTLASIVQRDFGRVDVSNVTYLNSNGIPIRAKLLKPATSSGTRLPGVVYIHGYQNNRETSDAYCIEMTRRGFVVLEVDAIGRGNSGIPGSMDDPDFDTSYGALTSFAYLKSLPYVDSIAVGLMGHSLGAEMVYNIALRDKSVKALTISGFAYTDQASPVMPHNMLMIYGKYDEYRQRMTGTKDVEAEWMASPQTQSAFSRTNSEFGITYGNFDAGTARKVVLLPAVHIQESHSRQGIAEAVTWMRSALNPPDTYWISPENQIWEIKEWSTLVAMVAGLGAIMPLGFILMKIRVFTPLQNNALSDYTCSKGTFWRFAIINGLLMWLYLPIILVLFAVHVYVIPIDGIFPMMMVNGTVWWFLWVNILGFLLLRRWLKRKSGGLDWYDLGVSFSRGRFQLHWDIIWRTILLAIILFSFAILYEFIIEKIFIVDYRFLFPFASDLTFYRLGMWFLYFPFLLLGFTLTGIFLHGQLRLPQKPTWWQTFINWSVNNVLVMVCPLAIFMLFQYVPILTLGFIPFVGPGGMLASFTMNLFHIIGVLIMVTPLSTWFYQLTGKPYLGAIVNAALVTWMFVSSQVIAPIPV